MGPAAGARSLVIASLRAFWSRGVEVGVHEGFKVDVNQRHVMIQPTRPTIGKTQLNYQHFDKSFGSQMSLPDSIDFLLS